MMLSATIIIFKPVEYRPSLGRGQGMRIMRKFHPYMTHILFFLHSGAPHGEVQDVQAYAPKTTFITDHHWMCCQPPAPESNSKPLKLRRLKIRKSRTKRTARMKPGDSGSDSQRPNDSTAPRHAAPMAFPTLFRAKITSGSSNCRSSQVQE